jgi:hypothetical protein
LTGKDAGQLEEARDTIRPGTRVNVTFLGNEDLQMRLTAARAARRLGTAGPDRFLRALAAAYDPGRHGEVRLHFYTFGGLQATAEWIEKFRTEGLS